MTNNACDLRRNRNIFVSIFLIFFALVFFLLRPYFSYLLLGIILAIIFNPGYKLVKKYIKHKAASSLIVILIILLIIIIPASFFLNSLIGEINSFLKGSGALSLQKAVELISQYANYNLDALYGKIIDFSADAGSYLLQNAFGYLTSVIDVIIGITIMIFIMHYLFVDGEKIYKKIYDMFPVKQKYRKELFTDMENLTKGILRGHLLTAVIQGVLGGIGLMIFGIKGAVLWTFVMIILALLPVVGAPLVIVVASIMKFFAGDIYVSIALMIWALFVGTIDNFIKPKLISSSAKVHPLIIILGVFGGLALFGFVGLFIGPIVISIFLLLFKFYNKDPELSC